MPSILVYAELSEGKITSTSLELMAKARELGDVYAVALGSGAKAAAATLGKHGAKVVHVNEDAAFDDYIAEPATDAMLAVVAPNVCNATAPPGWTPDAPYAERKCSCVSHSGRGKKLSSERIQETLAFG